MGTSPSKKENNKCRKAEPDGQIELRVRSEMLRAFAQQELVGPDCQHYAKVVRPRTERKRRPCV